MNKLILILFFLGTAFTIRAQKVYFIYIQSESEQPFFVKMDEKLYSSTSSGYLLLSKLRDTVYNFSIGFPQNKWPEHKFSVTINRKDHGYLLKNFDGKGWGIYNLQTLAIQMGDPLVSNKDQGKTDAKDVSQFTEILSKAADDPSLKEKPVKSVAEEKKPKTEPVVQKKEKVDTIKTEPIVAKPSEKSPDNSELAEGKTSSEPEVEKRENVVVQEKTGSEDEVPANDYKSGTSYKPSLVKKWSESSTTEGFGLVFIDEDGNGQKDTIRLLIPNPKEVEILVDKKEENKNEKMKFVEIIDTVSKEEEKITSIKPLTEDRTLEKSPANSVSVNCEERANENDFFQLRKQMAAAENDDEMILLAKKYFRQKCFSTLQIKNLSVLFLSDQGKYSFFDAAYNYVSDPGSFISLQSELKDEYYANRFRAMLRN